MNMFNSQLYTSVSIFYRYVFHVVVQGGIIYLCATPTNYRKARAFQFLDEVSLFLFFCSVWE